MKPFNGLVNAVRRPWIRRTASILGILLILFGLFGYLVLPGIIKSQAEQAASAALHRKFTIEKVEVHPYALAVAIHGIALREPDGQAIFASVQDLRVRISWASLWHLAPVIKQVRVNAPYVHLARTGPNRYSTDDIVAALSAAKPAEAGLPAEARSAKAGARFSVYNIQVEAGRLEFDDQPTGAHHVVTDFKLGIPFVSSLPSQEEVFVEPLLSAVINGSALLIKGKARPFAPTREAVLDLNLDRVDLPKYLEYLPFEPRFRMPAAQLDLHIRATFQQPSDRPPAVILAGRATLRSLQVISLSGEPMLALPELVIDVGKADVTGGRIEVSRVAATGLELNIVRNARGELNLAPSFAPGGATEGMPSAARSPMEGMPSEAAKAAKEGPPLKVTVAQFALQDAAVRFSDRNPVRPLEAAVEQLDLRISDTALDPQSRQLTIGRIDSDSARLRLQQGRSEPERQSVDLQATPPAVASERAASVAASGQPAASGAWSASVGRFAVGNWAARIESRGLPHPAVTAVTAIALAGENLSNAASSAPGRIELKARVNRRGSVSVVGALGLAPLHADLAMDLRGVDLLPLQPYFTDRINLLITQADFSCRGRLAMDESPNEKPDLRFKGNFQGEATLANLATIDKQNGNEFLNWKSLYFGGVKVRLSPLLVDIDQIALTEFFARVIIDPSARINLQDIVRASAGERRSLTSEQSPAAQTPAPQPAAAPGPVAATAIRIGQITLQAGRVRFTDNFIKPNYTANLAELGGAVTGLSSAADSAAAVDLRGAVNDAPLSITGSINPIKGDLLVDLKASVHGMELAPLSAYSGKYVGYGIERGKLSFDVAYKLEHRQLTAENRVVLDQLTFGDKVDSPTATSLPVQLAVALLKDRNGVIDVNLPIGGSLDDPQFSVGGVIVKVIVNLVTKAVTAPFALLGSLFGGGEELSFIEYVPGRTEVPAAGESRLNALAKALNERPGLKLEIAAWVDPGSDREGLRREGLARRVRALKVKDLVAKGESVTVAQVTVSPEEYPALLGRVYEANQLAKPRSSSGAQQALPPAEMEKLLLASTQISDDELTALGNRRSQAVKQWLQTTGQVPEQRLFLLATRLGPQGDAVPKSDSGARTSRVEFSLR